MLDIVGVVLVAAGWSGLMLVLYVVVRLAVSHGVQDAARAGRAAGGTSGTTPTPVSDVIRRQRQQYDKA